jgi:hypothetical protein
VTEPVRCLRSSTQELIRVDRSRTICVCAFKHFAAKNWNNLPDSIRACNSLLTFKTKFKANPFNLTIFTAPTYSLATYGALQM